VASSVYFHDKNNDGCITTEADTNDPDSLEIIQRFWYYPRHGGQAFGMAMQGLRDWATEPGQWYRYNGKERDTVSGWYEYGFRWYIDEIGRFAGVDPIADQFPWVSVYNYAENEPVGHIDLHGLQKVVYLEQFGKNSNGETFLIRSGSYEKGSHYYSVYANPERYGSRGTLKVSQNFDTGRYDDNIALNIRDRFRKLGDKIQNFFDRFDTPSGRMELSWNIGKGLETRSNPNAEIGPDIGEIMSAFGTAKGVGDLPSKSMKAADLMQFLNNSVQTGGALQDNFGFPAAKLEPVDSTCNSCNNKPHDGYPYRRMDKNGTVIDTIKLKH
jgi:RHS repeat-associated protein